MVQVMDLSLMDEDIKANTVTVMSWKRINFGCSLHMLTHCALHHMVSL